MFLHDLLGDGLDLLALDLIVIWAEEDDNGVLGVCVFGDAVVPLFEVANLNDARHVIHHNEGMFVPEVWLGLAI